MSNPMTVVSDDATVPALIAENSKAQGWAGDFHGRVIVKGDLTVQDGSYVPEKRYNGEVYVGTDIRKLQEQVAGLQSAVFASAAKIADLTSAQGDLQAIRDELASLRSELNGVMKFLWIVYPDGGVINGLFPKPA